jgi:hypothetical protein
LPLPPNPQSVGSRWVFPNWGSLAPVLNLAVQHCEIQRSGRGQFTLHSPHSQHSSNCSAGPSLSVSVQKSLQLLSRGRRDARMLPCSPARGTREKEAEPTGRHIGSHACAPPSCTSMPWCTPMCTCTHTQMHTGADKN